MLAALALAALLSAVPASGAGKPEADPSLPRPAKGQPLEYNRSLAHVHATYRLFEAAALQLRAIELAADKAKKERLSFELFDRIYCRAKEWDKAAAEILRTIRRVEKGNTAQERKYRIDRARVLEKAGRTEEYIRELERVAQLSVAGEDRERALLSLHMALKKLDRRQFESHLVSAARVVIDQDGEKKAIEWCKRMEKQYPQEAAVKMKVANLCVGLGQHKEAAQYYQNTLGLLERYTEKISIYFRLIETQINGQMYPEAEKSCRQALQLEIRSPGLRKRFRDLLNKALDLQGKPKE